jgi:hypothetical protein
LPAAAELGALSRRAALQRVIIFSIKPGEKKNVMYRKLTVASVTLSVFEDNQQ